MLPFLPFAMFLLRRRSETGGCGPVGCFIFLIVIGAVLYFVFKGRSDRRQVSGAAHRPMDSGPVQPNTFACPFPKCSNCGAAADKMKQQWDGLRAVTWTCGYCGNVQVQQLKDEELPPSARQRLGLDPGPGMVPGQGAGYAPQGSGMGSGVGGMLTGMMLGSMLGGGHHHHHNDDGWGGGSSDNGGGGWDSGDSGDSGGGWDSGGGDFGGGDSGGDW